MRTCTAWQVCSARYVLCVCVSMLGVWYVRQVVGAVAGWRVGAASRCLGITLAPLKEIPVNPFYLLCFPLIPTITYSNPYRLVFYIINNYICAVICW